MGLARERLVKLDFRQKEIEERLFDIQETLELQESFISQMGSDSSLEEARKKHLELVREQKELSEKMGMLLFEKEVLREKIEGEIQLRIKLKALMNIRATQLEALPKNIRVAITQINKDLDGAYTIKGELDKTIQLSYRLRVKLTDISEKLNGMTLWNRLKSALDFEYRKSINETHHQITLSTRLILEFEDTLEQLNQLQTKQKFYAQLSLHSIGIRHQPLSREWLTADTINMALAALHDQTQELDLLIEAFKLERDHTVNFIHQLTEKKKKFLMK